MKKSMTCAMLAVLVAVVSSSCTSTGGGRRFGRSSTEEPKIRVLLAENTRTLRFTSTAGFAVKAVSGLEILSSDGASGAEVTVDEGLIAFTTEPQEAVAAIENEAVIVPLTGSRFTFGKDEYPGELHVYVGAGGALSLLNVVPLETYVQGVLPYEIGNPGADGYDALKTQAVAARTYAWAKVQANDAQPFDVYATVQDQLYKGLSGRTKLTDAAVRETRGRILDFYGHTVRAYYSSCCGGHTSDIRLVWPDREPADYLVGIRDGDAYGSFCRDNRYFRWRYSFTGREMGEILRATLPAELGVDAADVGELVDMRIEKRSRSGRVIDLLIVTTRSEFLVSGDRIRWVLMPDVAAGRILPSVMFRLDKVMERDRLGFISVVGGGNGHGVGMCQNGAIAMAKRGYRYDMILNHYYPGCTVAKAY